MRSHYITNISDISAKVIIGVLLLILACYAPSSQSNTSVETPEDPCDELSLTALLVKGSFNTYSKIHLDVLQKLPPPEEDSSLQRSIFRVEAITRLFFDSVLDFVAIAEILTPESSKGLFVKSGAAASHAVVIIDNLIGALDELRTLLPQDDPLREKVQTIIDANLDSNRFIVRFIGSV